MQKKWKRVKKKTTVGKLRSSTERSSNSDLKKQKKNRILHPFTSVKRRWCGQAKKILPGV